MKAGIPIYNEDTPKRPGLYLGLMHGRTSPQEELSDWGFNGPLIGPLKYGHNTYNCEVKLEFLDVRARVENQMVFPERVSELDGHELQIEDSLLVCQGNYYGDWTFFYHDGPALE